MLEHDWARSNYPRGYAADCARGLDQTGTVTGASRAKATTRARTVAGITSQCETVHVHAAQPSVTTCRTPRASSPASSSRSVGCGWPGVATSAW